jgi:ABC-type anion transport system duplicated permease subunit
MTMEELATSVLAYALWPLLILSTVALWAAAALDILRHKRRGTFPNTGLLGMAAVVSVVAVIAVSGICAVFAGQWFEAVSRAGSIGTRASKPAGEDPRRAYTFSFGLENASYGLSFDSAGENRSENRLPR